MCVYVCSKRGRQLTRHRFHSTNPWFDKNHLTIEERRELLEKSRSSRNGRYAVKEKAHVCALFVHVTLDSLDHLVDIYLVQSGLLLDGTSFVTSKAA